ncbi:MAG: inorganic pyrophosphatase [Candidatus Vogelbacteria bacterium RIFOXYD1_FULL_46_19]|uniref:Inorganic pyrophosphatase n=1 Tax=Candidatus Vogelbacteria bacterium RIFOXYD1_FULL_46_19 TaxID=1802439 RepID=A0A1G2QJE0_9BACT|nr:MAG: inorganic pyrophosphatase [Candidatus Vogelbacteria bacterium RIFOXYD1_FULL_46_19]
MNLWHDVPAGTPDELNVIIEIPKLSRIKYELDKDTGLIHVDRVLYSPMHYPTNYGFVPQTLWPDGDPLDVLVMSHEPFVPGCLVKARPIGVMEMTDDGDSDAKVLSVPIKDPRYNYVKDITDLDTHTLEEIKHFFKVYKDLQKKEVIVADWRNASEAKRDIERSFVLYHDKFQVKAE